MSKKIKIKRAELDQDFRQKVKMLLDSAEREVVIITGEGAAFGFQDLRYATERAVERGVKVKIHTVTPTPEFLNKVMLLGCKVYRGRKKIKDHFLVIDGRDWVISREHPPSKVGERRGEVYLNDRNGAKRVLTNFNRLIQSAEEVKTPMWELDPLVEAIKHPKSWGVKTDARKFREELFG